MAHWLRDRIGAKSRGGFWFAPFQRQLRHAYEYRSLCRQFDRYVESSAGRTSGAVEIYQLALLVIVALWFVFIRSPIAPLVGSPVVQILGALVALVLVTDLFLFFLHWVFAAVGPLASSQRSLAMCLVNIPQLALMFSVLQVLSDCDASTDSLWVLFHNNLRETVTLGFPSATGAVQCVVLSHYQWLIDATLMLIIIASLVGAIVRHERPDCDAA